MEGGYSERGGQGSAALVICHNHSTRQVADLEDGVPEGGGEFSVYYCFCPSYRSFLFLFSVHSWSRYVLAFCDWPVG